MLAGTALVGTARLVGHRCTALVFHEARAGTHKALFVAGGAGRDARVRVCFGASSSCPARTTGPALSAGHTASNRRGKVGVTACLHFTVFLRLWDS